MRQVVGGLVMALVTVSACGVKADADPGVLRFACFAKTAKAGPVSQACGLFRESLSAQYPGLKITTVAGNDTADVSLSVRGTTPNALVAQVAWDQQAPSRAMGITLRDGTLSEAALRRFFDRLLLANPR